MAVVMGGDKSRGVGREMQIPTGVLHLEFVELVLPVLFPEIELTSAGATGTGYNHAIRMQCDAPGNALKSFLG